MYTQDTILLRDLCAETASQQDQKMYFEFKLKRKAKQLNWNFYLNFRNVRNRSHCIGVICSSRQVFFFCLSQSGSCVGFFFLVNFKWMWIIFLFFFCARDFLIDHVLFLVSIKRNKIFDLYAKWESLLFLFNDSWRLVFSSNFENKVWFYFSVFTFWAEWEKESGLNTFSVCRAIWQISTNLNFEFCSAIFFLWN